MAGQLAPGYITITGALPGTQSIPAVVAAYPPPSVAVPDVTGFTEAAATQSLQSLGFSVRSQPVQSRAGTPGNVLSQSPPAPTPSAPGTLVQIFIIQAAPPAPIDLTKRFDDLDTALKAVKTDTADAIAAARRDIASDVSTSLDSLRTAVKTDTADAIAAARRDIAADVSASVSGVQSAIATAILDSQRVVIAAFPNPPGDQAQQQQAPAQKGSAR